MITIQVCSVCKSAEIERKEWVQVNSGKNMGICDEDIVWCPQCEKHIEAIDFKTIKAIDEIV